MMTASGNLRAGFMYDPLNPRPTENDVWAAEHNAREHGQRAAEAMSGRDSWRSIEEQERANRAQRDADEMRNRIWMNEREDRRRQEDAQRQAELAQRQIGGQPWVQGEVVQVAAEDVPTREDIFAAQVKSLQPSPYPGLVDRPGYCFMCGAHLLGKRRKCEKCKRHPPQKYSQWKMREMWKAEQLRRLWSEKNGNGVL